MHLGGDGHWGIYLGLACICIVICALGSFSFRHTAYATHMQAYPSKTSVVEGIYNIHTYIYQQYQFRNTSSVIPDRHIVELLQTMIWGCFTPSYTILVTQEWIVYNGVDQPHINFVWKSKTILVCRGHTSNYPLAYILYRFYSLTSWVGYLDVRNSIILSCESWRPLYHRLTW